MDAMGAQWEPSYRAARPASAGRRPPIDERLLPPAERRRPTSAASLPLRLSVPNAAGLATTHEMTLLSDLQTELAAPSNGKEQV